METRHTLTYGELPSEEVWREIVPNEPYPMELSEKDHEIAALIINQGIDSHLEAVFFTQSPALFRGMSKVRTTIDDRESLRVFIRRAIELQDEYADSTDDHSPMALASAILETLGIEWV